MLVRPRPLRALALVVALAIGASAAIAAPEYVVTDLGSLGNPLGSGAVSLNGRGTSVGYSFVAGSGYVHAMVNRYGVVTDLGTLGGTQSLARGVNHLGWVVGWSYLPGSTTQAAFLWRDGEMTVLPDIGGHRSDAQSLNDDGVVVGSAFDDHLNEHAVWWQDGVVHDMGTLGGTTSRTYDINGRGVMCGMASPSLGVYHAFVAKRNEPLVDLGTLGGEAAHAYAINDLEHVCGWSYLSLTSPASRAFFWAGDGLVPLPTLGGVYSAAFALNNSDRVVGAASDVHEQQFAVMWNGVNITNLNSLIDPGAGWVLTRAWDVDDHGAIVGEGLYLGQPRAFMLTPAGTTSVPGGPSAAALAFAGALPNPVREGTHFQFTLPAADHVRLELFDATGRRVRALTERDYPAGLSRVAWDGTDEHGQRSGPGVYWARLTAGAHVLVRRVAVVQ